MKNTQRRDRAHATTSNPASKAGKAPAKTAARRASEAPVAPATMPPPSETRRRAEPAAVAAQLLDDEYTPPLVAPEAVGSMLAESIAELGVAILALERVDDARVDDVHSMLFQVRQRLRGTHVAATKATKLPKPARVPDLEVRAPDLISCNGHAGEILERHLPDLREQLRGLSRRIGYVYASYAECLEASRESTQEALRRFRGARSNREPCGRDQNRNGALQMSLLNQVNITVDTLEGTAADIRQLEQIVVADVDEETRAHLGVELAKIRRRLELLTRGLHDERRMTCRR